LARASSRAAPPPSASRRPVPQAEAFRPFFLAGAVQAVLVIGLWGAAFPLVALIDSPLAPGAWHAHELLFGYVPAVQAGFLLTALPHWTGRRAVGRVTVALLLALWIAGRLAAAGLLGLGPAAVAVVAIAFPAVLAALVTREVVAARSFANAPATVSLVVLVAAQILFHAELAAGHAGDAGARLALAGVTAQMMLLGGRIVPAFTRDWMAETGRGPLPAPFGRFDAVAVAVGLAALVAWLVLPVAGPAAPLVGTVLLAAGVLLLVRQARWTPIRTLAEPLVWVLHVGAAMLPLGLLVGGAATLAERPDLAAAVTHLWAIGGIGLMTLALMTRVSLGHTGRPLRAVGGSSAVYLALAAAAAARVASVIAPQWLLPLLPLAGLLWIAGYAGFLVLYGPMLVRPAAAPEPAAHSPPR
jgi:uncharacterized protein involved in response to NO